MKQSFKVIDYETTGFLTYKGDKIFAYIITDEDMQHEVRRLDNTSKIKNEVSHGKLVKFFQDTSIVKVAHNAKFEMGFTAEFFDGTLPKSEWHDTIIMSQILKNLMRGHGLDDLANRYFSANFKEECERWNYWDKQVKLHLTTQKRLLGKYPTRFIEEILNPMYENGITPLVTDRPNYGLVPLKTMNEYQIGDGERGMMLFTLMIDKIKEDPLIYEDYLNEMELLKVSQKMEQTGMMVHKQNANELITDLTKRLVGIDKEKKKFFGFDINLDSADQLQKHLFGHINKKKHEKLDQDWKKIKPAFNFVSPVATGSGGPSAAKEPLIMLNESVKHPVFDMILRYRAFSKGITNIQSYIDLGGDNSIIHTSINTNKARTGRQSVSQPNLQNVAKEFSVNTVHGIPARKCFRPRPGFVYFLGDYAGIEMRLIISESNEEFLIDALNKDEDYDVHTYNAIAILGQEFKNITDDKIKKNVRSDIKNATFGKAYGCNLETFAKAIRKSVSDTRPLLKNFQSICPKICDFTKDTMDEVKTNGYITTAFGRKLSVERELAYTGSNYKIQGTAAGILKRAEVNTQHYLETEWSNDIKMLLTVHDEIILEYPRNLLDKACDILHDISFCMTNMKEIKVPLVTEWKMSTTSWQDAKEYKI